MHKEKKGVLKRHFTSFDPLTVDISREIYDAKINAWLVIVARPRHIGQHANKINGCYAVSLWVIKQSCHPSYKATKMYCVVMHLWHTCRCHWWRLLGRRRRSYWKGWRWWRSPDSGSAVDWNSSHWKTDSQRRRYRNPLTLQWTCMQLCTACMLVSDHALFVWCCATLLG